MPVPSGDDILAEQFEELQLRYSKSELENASLRMQLVSLACPFDGSEHEE